MQKRRKIFWLFLISLILLGIGFILTNSTRFGFCTHDQYNCRDLFNNIGDPLFFGMSALALVFLALLILPNAWPAWKKFAKWYIPIAALVFIFYQGPGAMDLFSPYPEQVYKWIGIIYVAVSAVIILFASAKNRK